MDEQAIDKTNNDCRRIFFLIDGLEGDGAERQLCELVKGLDARPDYEPHVGVLEATDSGHAWMLEELGIPVNLFARASRFDLSPLSRIIRYIRQKDIDIVHTYMSMGGEFGLIAGKFCGVPVITSSIRNSMNRDWREKFRTFYQSHLADIAIANSRAGFTSRFKRIPDSFRVVYNGLDLDRFDIAEMDRRALVGKLQLSADRPLVCMAARMESQKDHRTLITAMQLLLLEQPDVMLLLAGDGTLRAEIEAQVQSLQLDDAVRFLGYRSDVEQIISICDVSVLLTNTEIHLEGISNTIIESMALGTAVLATRGGGTDEILSDDDTGSAPYEYGIKVDPFDPRKVAEGLTYYISNRPERTRIALAAQSMVRDRFNLQRYIADNVALYQELEQNGLLRARET